MATSVAYVCAPWAAIYPVFFQFKQMGGSWELARLLLPNHRYFKQLAINCNLIYKVKCLSRRSTFRTCLKAASELTWRRALYLIAVSWGLSLYLIYMLFIWNAVTFTINQFKLKEVVVPRIKNRLPSVIEFIRPAS